MRRIIEKFYNIWAYALFERGGELVLSRLIKYHIDYSLRHHHMIPHGMSGTPLRMSGRFCEGALPFFPDDIIRLGGSLGFSVCLALS